MDKELIFATSNPNKLKEVREILGNSYKIHGLDSLNFHEEIPETQDTIEGNARQKVEYISRFTDKPVFAEDTGLIVEALDGAPGVFSARYAGEHKSAVDNMAKILQELSEHPNRKAHFKTVIAYRSETGQLYTFTGKVFGEIITESRGNQGFGYDPIFQPEGYQETFGELGDEIKNTISHRRKALEKFISFLQEKSTR